MQIVGCLPPLVGFLGEAFPDEAIESRRRERLDGRNRRRSVLQDRADQARLALPSNAFLPVIIS